MPQSWTELRQNVSGLLGDPGNVAFDTNVVDSAILFAAREIATELSICEEVSTITTVAGTDSYILGAGPTQGSFNGLPYRVKQAFIQISGFTWQRLTEASDRSPTVFISQDLPREYSFQTFVNYLSTEVNDGPTITLYRVPNAAYTVKLIVLTIPADSSANPNGPSMPPEAEELTILRAVRRLRMAEGNAALDADFGEEDPLEVHVARSGKEKAARGHPWR